MNDYCFSTENWPGLSKLIEECGEVTQVAAKIIGRGGKTDYWGGRDLTADLQAELGDLLAIIEYTIQRNQLDRFSINRRIEKKLSWYEDWEKEHNVEQL
jgi:NTP pyrophosphatase (non-canonical NTP hydrolase)